MAGHFSARPATRTNKLLGGVDGHTAVAPIGPRTRHARRERPAVAQLRRAGWGRYGQPGLLGGRATETFSGNRHGSPVRAGCGSRLGQHRVLRRVHVDLAEDRELPVRGGRHEGGAGRRRPGRRARSRARPDRRDRQAQRISTPARRASAAGGSRATRPARGRPCRLPVELSHCQRV